MSDTLVRMHLEYVHPWPNHAGLFVARKEGFYAEEGLDVDLVSDGDDRGDAAAKLARGEYDLASVRLGQVVESRGTDTPLIAIGTFNQRQLGAVMTTPDTGIRRFADLEGRRVAIPPVGRLVQELREAVLADGADPDRVIIEHPEWEVDIRAVEQGLWEAVFNVRAWEPFQGNTPPDQVVIIEFDEVGVAPHHSYFICARQEALRHDTELYRRFLAATARGYRRAMEDEEAVVRAMSAALWHVSPAVIRASTRKIRDSWFTREGRWGEIQADLVDSYTRWMREGGWTTAPVEATCGAWRNDLLA